jgi:hypothetical protein
VGLALRKSGGASTELEEVVSELEGLAVILQDIETLSPSSADSTQLNALKRHA